MALQPQNSLTSHNRVNFQDTIAPRAAFQDNRAPQNAGLVPQNAGPVPQITAPAPHIAPEPQSALMHQNKPSARVLGRGGDNYLGRGGDNYLGRGGDNYRTTPATHQLGRDRRHSASSDDNTLSNQILFTDRSHERPYDVPLLSVKQILQTIEAILARANKPVDLHGTVVPGGLVPATAHVDTLEHEKAMHANLSSLHDSIDVPTGILNEISCEILSKSLSGADANKTTMDILERVQHYDWDEKLVLALASFAIKDGEFWLVAQLFTTNALAKAIGQLKQMQEILERSGTSLKPKFDAYNTLVNAVLKVTKIIVHLQDLNHDPHLTPEIKATSPTNHIPTAVYWTIRSIVILASQLLGITGSDPEYVTEAWELASLAHKLENIYNHLEENLTRLNLLIQKFRDEEAFNAIARILESPHIDNSKPLRVLFYKDDQPALFDGYNKKRVDIDVLRRKVVILMISDLEIAQENEYLIAQQMHAEKRQFPTRPESQYEIVWVPIVDNWTDAKQRQFEELRSGMEWYTVYHPSVVSPIVVKYIKHQKKWNFVKKPLLVVMDPQGKIVHTNAVHMMCVFGSAAYPFTSTRERLLWEEETWRIELLADAIDQTLLNWISEKKYICLYGGEDINWIRNFTRAAKDVALDAGIQLELLYLGKSKQKERVAADIIRAIKEEKLSHTIDWNLIWFFWVRIESMWQSKGQLLSELSRANFRDDNIRNDIIMQGIVSLLSFGSSDRGWAVIGVPSAEMSKANGDHMLKSMNDFKIWKPRHNEIGFTSALNEYLTGVHKSAPHHCTSLILPATGVMPETVACAECGRLMERYAMFRCCTD
ncbi:protein SIEVE ELEMENT OCCLUSION B-like [Argentina anserina]|uniref:protein SIEVE ELEMENT OCCLUSION B-like n=1 Tax=Argentina anserina TaxID=57926 RepID=UPI002176294D|nr:protein SIEVE ELEMENT OCCLUSION B-like [Potentilla anserina]